MLLNHLEQMFEEICRTLISILFSSGHRQFKSTAGECNAERRSSEEFRLLWCKVSSDLWAHRPCLSRDADSSQRHRTVAPALPCPETGSAQQHAAKYVLENLPREVFNKLCVSLYLRTAHAITFFQVFLFFSSPAN